MFESRGRHNVMAYVDGNYVMVKKPLMSGNDKRNMVIVLPKEWVDQNSQNKAIKYLLLDVKDALITVKPYYEAIEGVE
jgi:hypothetical protein